MTAAATPTTPQPSAPPAPVSPAGQGQAPLGETEQYVAELWQSLLGAARVERQCALRVLMCDDQ